MATGTCEKLWGFGCSGVVSENRHSRLNRATFHEALCARGTEGKAGMVEKGWQEQDDRQAQHLPPRILRASPCRFTIAKFLTSPPDSFLKDQTSVQRGCEERGQGAEKVKGCMMSYLGSNTRARVSKRD